MFDYKFCRRASGWAFLSGNMLTILLNTVNPNWFQFFAGILFTVCSITTILSASNHRWLFLTGFTVIAAYVLVAFSTTGDGTWLKYIGGLTGLVGGLLVWRAAFQRETKKQYDLPYPLSLVDRYPLAGAGIIEGLGCVFILMGALMNNDMRLTFLVVIWIIGYITLIASDEFLRQSFQKDLSAQPKI
jgi:hypothetical protein